MFEEYTKRNRAIQAALDLAAEGGWKAVIFAAISERTGLSLADLRRDFTCKLGQIVLNGLEFGNWPAELDAVQ